MSGPPTPASPQDLANQQNSANFGANTVTANSSNFTTPYGQTTYGNNNGQITQNSQYSGAEQPLFNFMTGLLQPGAEAGAGGALGNFLNQTGGTAAPNLVGPGNNLAQQYASLATQAVEPNMAWMIQNNQNNLANQGLFESTNTQTPNNAADRSMQNMYSGLGQAISGFQSRLLPQAVNAEQMQNFSNPMQAIQQFMQEGAPIGLPTSGTSPLFSSNPVNAVQAQQNSYNQNANAFGNTVGAVGTGLDMLGGIFGA